MTNQDEHLIYYQYSPNDDNFSEVITLRYDLDDFEFNDLVGLIKFKPNAFFDFDTTKGQLNARGYGAIRQVYQKLIKEITNTILLRDGEYFVKLNLDHPFWSSRSNCRAFGRFINLVIMSGCIFPFHFPVSLIEELTQPLKRLNVTEMLYFVEKLDPDVYRSIKNIKNLDPDYFENDSKLTEIGFDSLYEMLSQIIYKDYSANLGKIYKDITNSIILFDGCTQCYPNTPTIDYILSGGYQLTPEIVFGMTNIVEPYRIFWKNFIFSLKESELKQLLIIFTNSLSTDQEIQIDIDLDTTIDLNISVCHKTVTISSKLFNDANTLDGLRIYFQDAEQSDTISDGIPGSNRSGQNSIDAIQQTFNHGRSFESIVEEIYNQHIDRSFSLPTNHQAIGRGLRSESHADLNQFRDLNRYGQRLIETYQLDIGGSQMDREYGLWLDIWYELERERNTIQSNSNPIYFPLINSISNYITFSTPIGIIYLSWDAWNNPPIASEASGQNQLVRFIPSRRSHRRSSRRCSRLDDNHYVMIRNLNL